MRKDELIKMLDGTDDRVEVDTKPCKEIKFELLDFRIIENELYSHVLCRYLPVVFYKEGEINYDGAKST